MLIHEACKKCSLTKKAIEYYTEHGLISPAIQENGYRDFSNEDIIRLQKISVLRALGLSVAEISTVLTEQNALTFHMISEKRRLEISVLQEKQKLIQELIDSQNWEQARRHLQQLEQKQSVLERLIHAFPGYYGRYLSLHFAPYLNEPIQTDEQQKAFDTIIAFLDNVQFNIPDDLQNYLNEITVHFDEAFEKNMSSAFDNMIQNTEKYITEHRADLEKYMHYKQSADYKSSPAYHLEQSLRQFTSASGYNDVFIPAMCRLSKSYQEYFKGLQKANEKFIREYPNYPQLTT